MSEIPKNNNIFGYKPVKPTITKTPFDKIKPPPIQDRFNPNVEDDLTVDLIEETPIPALYCSTTDEFFVVEMLGIYAEGIKQKVKEFALLIIGEIEQPNDSVTHDHLYEKHGLFKDRKKKEGELQLMNVAVTRARRELHLLFPIDMETWKNDEDASNPWKFLRSAKYNQPGS